MELTDAAVAAADLVGRTGARHLQVGYVHDDVPSEDAGWFAHAQYRGARITVEAQTGPGEALEALARRILTGAKCVHCGGLVALSRLGAVFYRDAVMADGSRFTETHARAVPQCQWRRVGKRWVAGCQERAHG